MTAAVNRSALRGLEVLEAFRVARRPLSLSEIARLAALPVSTCHGVVRALERRGFLYSLAPRELYPTRRLWDLAVAIHDHDPVLERFAPALAELRDATAETAILGVRQGEHVLYLLVLEGTHTIRYSSHAGAAKPLHSSAIGKILLSTMPGSELDAWLGANPLPAVTARTIVSREGLRADLERARARGYAVTRGENVEDVMAIAAPLRFGTTTFGIAVAGPLHRLEAAEARLGAELRERLRALENGDARCA
jgi:IclR family transcriptional regulator, acetate operon repressor